MNKFTAEQVERAAKKAAKAFQKWNTSNQGASQKEMANLQHEMHMACLKLMQKVGVDPNDFPSWKDYQ